MPRISVLMPFKNAATFITTAVESILNQDFSDFELLTIDDHSTDASYDLVAQFDDPRIRLLPSTGRGISAALNTGLAAMHPETRYIARQDADDRSAPTRLHTQFRYLQTHPDVTVLASQAALLDYDNVTTGTFVTPHQHSEIVAAFTTHNPICHGSVMVDARPVIGVGGYDSAFDLAEGYELWVRLARRGAQFAALPDTLYEYRMYEQSWSRSNRPARDTLLAQVAALAASDADHGSHLLNRDMQDRCR